MWPFNRKQKPIETESEAFEREYPLTAQYIREVVRPAVQAEVADLDRTIKIRDEHEAQRWARQKALNETQDITTEERIKRQQVLDAEEAIWRQKRTRLQDAPRIGKS